MNKTNEQRKIKNKNKIKHMQAIRAMQPCKPCIHAKNDLNGPRVPKWA